jgi:hypothetical protein
MNMCIKLPELIPTLDQIQTEIEKTKRKEPKYMDFLSNINFLFNFQNGLHK